MKPSIQKEIELLLLYSKTYYTRQWTFATAGNFSVYDRESKTIWITASGKDKGNLKIDDFIPISIIQNHPIDATQKPSAETSIHRTIYNTVGDVGCILHVHTPSSCILWFGVTREEPKYIHVPNSEIIKAFGNFTEEPNLTMLVSFNHGEVKKIAQNFENEYNKKKLDIPFFLIENHGITVWGKNVHDANKNLEAAEFIIQIIAGRS